MSNRYFERKQEIIGAAQKEDVQRIHVPKDQKRIKDGRFDRKAVREMKAYHDNGMFI